MAGFQQLRGQGFCHRRVLQWLRDLGVPLESPRVEFVLLCLQRHLGIVYGVVSRGQDLSDQTGRISRRMICWLVKMICFLLYVALSLQSRSVRMDVDWEPCHEAGLRAIELHSSFICSHANSQRSTSRRVITCVRCDGRQRVCLEPIKRTSFENFI